MTHLETLRQLDNILGRFNCVETRGQDLLTEARIIVEQALEDEGSIERQRLELMAATLPEEAVSYWDFDTPPEKITAAVAAKARVAAARAIQAEVAKGADDE